MTLAKKSILMMGLKLAGGALAFLLSVAIARIIGKDDFGAYMYVFSWLSLFYMVITGGALGTFLRRLAKLSAEGGWGLLYGFITTGGRVLLAASTATAFVVLALSWVLQDRLPLGLLSEYAVMATLIPINVMLFKNVYILQSLSRPLEAYFPPLALRPVALLALIFIANSWAGIELDAFWIWILDLPATILALAMLSWTVRKMLMQMPAAMEQKVEWGQWVGAAAPFYGLSAMGILMSQSDMLLLGAISGNAADTGEFAAAFRVAMVVQLGMTTINSVAIPEISRHYAENNMAELSRIVKRMSLGIAAYTLPVSLAILAGGEWIMTLFGDDFTDGYILLVILALGQMAAALAGPVGYIMTVTNLHSEAFRIMAVTLIFDFALNALLIPQYGAIGAAIACSAATLTWNCLMAIVIWKRLRLNTTVLYFLTDRLSAKSRVPAKNTSDS